MFNVPCSVGVSSGGMTTKRPVPQHLHGATGYAYGCRCLECKAGHSERFRAQRTLGSGSKKTIAKLARPKPLGDIERAVIAEVELMARPPAEVDVLAARNLAAILDEPLLVSRHARVTAQLVTTLKTMHGDDKRTAKRRNPRRLATVQRMTTGRTTT